MQRHEGTRRHARRGDGNKEGNRRAASTATKIATEPEVPGETGSPPDPRECITRHRGECITRNRARGAGNHRAAETAATRCEQRMPTACTGGTPEPSLARFPADTTTIAGLASRSSNCVHAASEARTSALDPSCQNERGHNCGRRRSSSNVYVRQNPP